MKKYNILKKAQNKVGLFLFLAVLFGGLSSCNFLDIVPEETATEADAFKDKAALTRYLYSCYSYLPDPRSGSESLDLFTTDEIVTAFEHETFAKFPQGNYTSSSPVISYWSTLFKGIRQCYLMLENIDNVPDVDAETVQEYKAEATFLIAYYHFLLLKCYGPIILITELPDINMSQNDFPARTPYDQCVDWISFKFEEAISLGLQEKHNDSSFGRATKTAALAIKGRMLLYAASPLFNGGYCEYPAPKADNLMTVWQNYKTKENEYLINPVYDVSKWVRAAQANLEAITAAEKAGFRLYNEGDLNNSWKQPEDVTQRILRFVFVDRTTPELIMADTRTEGYYSLQRKTTPFNPSKGGSWNGISPTMRIIETFYTENGLPINEDPSYSYQGRLDYPEQTIYDSINWTGQTLNLNKQREPRFYSWIAFHNSWYEVFAFDDDLGSTKNSHERFIVQFFKNDNCGIQGRNNNYSPTGYLNKKGVHPEFSRNTGGSIINYPWPVVRLAELYLNYAEALIEVGGEANLTTAKIYIDKVRTRAGIPTVDVAWSVVPSVILDQNKLREIVRQERTIELYLEGHRFWDVRRWLLGTEFFNEKAQGMNYNGANAKDFFKIQDVSYARKFVSPTNYLLPLPIKDIDKNPKIIQNVGY